MQIDDLLRNLDNANSDLERLGDEKDQEIMILQEGMDSTLQQLSETQQASYPTSLPDLYSLHLLSESRHCGRNHKCTDRHLNLGQSQEIESDYWSENFCNHFHLIS
jgi:hypothetical protein